VRKSTGVSRAQSGEEEQQQEHEEEDEKHQEFLIHFLFISFIGRHHWPGYLHSSALISISYVLFFGISIHPIHPSVASFFTIFLFLNCICL